MILVMSVLRNYDNVSREATLVWNNINNYKHTTTCYVNSHEGVNNVGLGRKFVGANVTGGECVKSGGEWSGGERVRGLKVCIPM